MITSIILAIIQFLDDACKHIRCYSRCCNNANECLCSNDDPTLSLEEGTFSRNVSDNSQISHDDKEKVQGI